MILADPLAAASLGGGGESATYRSHRRSWLLLNVVLYVVSFAIALVLASGLVLAATNSSPTDVLAALLEGSFGTAEAVGVTLEQTTPILIVAVGVVIANRAGAFTIGPEGQFLVGGSAAALWAFKVGGPPGVALPLCLVGAALGGGIWAGIAALLRHWRSVDVIISTLLLNFIAIEVVSFMLNKTWLLQEDLEATVDPQQSARLAPAFQLPRLGNRPGFSVTVGLVLGVAVLAVLVFALSRTRWGLRLRMLGLNPDAARAAGVSVAAVGGGALVLSGALAGLAGGVWFTGIGHRVTPGFSANYGYEGLLVALTGRQSAVAVLPIAVFFGMLRSGGGYLAATGVPRYLVDVVQALIVLAALMPPAVLHVWERSRALRMAKRAAQNGPHRAEEGAV